MLIVKNKKQQEFLKRRGYNPNKRFQYMTVYPLREHNIENIKDQFNGLIFYIITQITLPFMIMFQLFKLLRSFIWWRLVYTKNNISSEEKNNEQNN